MPASYGQFPVTLMPDKATDGQKTVGPFEAAGGYDSMVRRLKRMPPTETASAIAAATPGPRLPFKTLAELRQEPTHKIEWLVEGLLPNAGLSLLGASAKAGKSTLSRCLAAAVALETADWLGRKTETGDVVHFALEESAATLLAHYEKLGVPEDRIHVYTGRFAKTDDMILFLQDAIQEYRPALVLIDPLFRFCRVKDAGSYTELIAAMDPLIEITRTLPLHIMVVHHNRKAGGSFGDEVLGSTAISASVDTVISMQRTADARVLYAFGRNNVEVERTALIMDENGWVDVNGPAAKADSTVLKNRIIDFVQEADKPVRQSAIIDHLKARRQVIGSALGELFESGQLHRTGTPGGGGGYLYSIPDSLP